MGGACAWETETQKGKEVAKRTGGKQREGNKEEERRENKNRKRQEEDWVIWNMLLNIASFFK
jgi:hypothetical protein